jgi:Rnl2 family RNA ligase
MAFHQYSKIAGHSLNWSDHYRKVDEWAVTEKVHGSNFSFIYFRDGTIKYAKRTSEIKEGERFFQFETILDSTIPKIQDLFTLILADRPTLTQIQVYGELFGGIFPTSLVTSSLFLMVFLSKKEFIILLIFILSHLIFM